MTDAKRDTARDEARDHAPLWTPPPEFLRELPDLISGKDPELLRPEARAWMLRDPQARELAQEICGAIATFADVPSRMARTTPEPISLRAKRSVERAAKQLPQRLAEVLWPLLTLELDRVAIARGGRLRIPTKPDDSFAAEGEALSRDRDCFLEELARSGRWRSVQHAVQTTRNSMVGMTAAASRARNLIRAFRVCLPRHSMGVWSSLLLDYFGGAALRIEEWRSFTVASKATAYHDYVLLTSALVRERLRDFVGAIDLCDEVLRIFPQSAVRSGAAYLALKLASSMTTRNEGTKYIRLLSNSLEAMPSEREHWRARLLADAAEWRAIAEQQPRVINDVFALLGSRT